jgi:hydroxymethylpyrimidine pyrophosphatase-like HAD family hydrolase
MVLSLADAIARNPAKISVNGLGKDLAPLAREITAHFGASVSVIPSDGMKFLNIPAAKASKPGALRYLLTSRSITMDDVVAFGDDTPDIEMLVECGISIAMANAIPEVLTAARYRTAGNDDDGVAVVLERVIRIPGV